MQIYADNAATTKMSQAAINAMLPYLREVYGNPSSLHSIGQQANEALTDARRRAAAVLGCQPREFTFTSGGSEADNQAIRSAALLGARKGKKHIISTAFEHHAVLHTLAKLEKEGFEVTYLKPDAMGRVSVEDLKAALRRDTILVSIMMVNNEVGSVMPIAQMADKFPEAYEQFVKVCALLEDHYRDMQDMEFTVENGKLYMLQTRNGKRTAKAALKIACDLLDEGMIDEKKAVAMIDPRNLDTLLHPQFDAKALKEATPIGRGLGASPGAACGKVVFSAEDAEKWAARGEKVVLVRLETSPEDITGMKVAQGILTVRGGMTSHAAVVARGMGSCCVSGCGEINMDEEHKQFTLGGKTYHEGDFISIDGSTGNIYEGVIPTVDAEIAGEFGRIMALADKYRTMKVRTNADTPTDAKKAKELGAEGIGLCRTEHMFFDPERIAAFREMICSDTVAEREAALDKILPYQQGDFEKLYEALEGSPVCIRFLDPPLHEFVPTTQAEIEQLAAAQGKSVEAIKAIIASLHEFNPMMGHRGCRLTVTYPEIAKMQTKAIIRAAINVKKAHPDWDIKPEIMIPLVGETKELAFVKKVVVETADAEIAAAGVELTYEVGTMIEIPRAALTADEIAKEAEFFCFGTNDLTQMTFGFSRDDAGKFLNAYYEAKIYENDPFAKLDQNGVGKLMKVAMELGKKTRPNLHCGICGEHGGDPASVEFCNALGLDYVSCSPFRVPIARLAAAQAAIKQEAEKADAEKAAEKAKAADREKAKEAAKEAAKEFAENAKEAAAVVAADVADAAKAGFAGAKAGLAAAKKAYLENRNK